MFREKIHTVQAYIDELTDKYNLESMLLLSHQPLIGNILEYIADEKG